MRVPLMLEMSEVSSADLSPMSAVSGRERGEERLGERDEPSRPRFLRCGDSVAGRARRRGCCCSMVAVLSALDMA